MNKTIVGRVVLSHEEHSRLIDEAQDESLSALLRRKIGLPPLKRGGSLPGHKKASKGAAKNTKGREPSEHPASS